MKQDPTFELREQVALITGAGRGVGAGIAKMLAKAGATIAVNDLYLERARETSEVISAQNGEATPYGFDVRDLAQVLSATKKIEHELGPISILINNAGVPDPFPMKPFREMLPEEWRTFIDLNLYGSLNCVHAVINSMCKQKYGRIITIVSEAWRAGTHLGISMYGASKAAAIGFSRHLAWEVGRDGVTANCLSLGEMDNLPYAEELAKRYPTGRVGTPQDVATAALFLASKEAGWITGQTWAVNGGLLTA